MNPLLPVRHPEQDFFICDVLDAIPKDDMASMEHPIFSLSTKLDTRIRKYEHNGTTIEVVPSEAGLATIHDKDILIYCISQLIARMNDGVPLHKTLHLRAYDLLVATNRRTDGDAYQRLKEAFTRLRGTTIVTNIKTNQESITEGFGLINSWRILRQTHSGRMSEIKVELSDWMFNAIMGKEVLTLHRDYFRLRKPLERRMYELARKHCGQQESWRISLDNLRKKCGSSSTDKEFRRLVAKICEEDAVHQHMPDYAMALESDVIRFINRQSGQKNGENGTLEPWEFPMLAPETYHEARMAAPGHDVHWLEQEWQRCWCESGRPELQNPDRAFVAFCKKRYENKPLP